MFQEAALFPWLTARGNVEPRAEARARSNGTNGAPRRRRAPRPGEPRQLQQQAPARAVRRDAPARRARPRARAGRRRHPHGRAVRCARRHDPRPAARRARAALERDRPHRALRHPQRARGGAARRPGRAAVEPSRVGSSRSFPSTIPRPRRIDSPEVSELAATITDQLREEVRRHGGGLDQELTQSGLDDLEVPLAPPQPAAAASSGGATWPKLLGHRDRVRHLAVPLARSSGSRGSRSRRPSEAFALHLRQLRPALRRGAHDARARAVRASLIALVIGSVVGALVARIPVLRAAIGSMITGLQTMPSVAWFPAAIVLFKLTEAAILFVVVLGAAPSIANGLINGIDNIPPVLLRAGRVLGATPVRRVPQRDPPRRAAVVRRRAQAGLGVRVAQPARGRAARADPRASSRSASSSTRTASSATRPASTH